jgi:hypothetical protein
MSSRRAPEEDAISRHHEKTFRKAPAKRARKAAGPADMTSTSEKDSSTHCLREERMHRMLT